MSILSLHLGKDHGLVPVVGEDYYDRPELDGVSYKAVAVVKKSNQGFTFKTLKGKKSCHTGAGKTAGWNVPVGTLLRLEIMRQDESCNAYSSAGKFFEKSCVPSKLDKRTFIFSFSNSIGNFLPLIFCLTA